MCDVVFCRRIWCPVRTVAGHLTQTDWKFIREAVALVLAKSQGTPVNRYIKPDIQSWFLAHTVVNLRYREGNFVYSRGTAELTS